MYIYQWIESTSRDASKDNNNNNNTKDLDDVYMDYGTIRKYFKWC